MPWTTRKQGYIANLGLKVSRLLCRATLKTSIPENQRCFGNFLIDSSLQSLHFSKDMKLLVVKPELLNSFITLCFNRSHPHLLHFQLPNVCSLITTLPLMTCIVLSLTLNNCCVAYVYPRLVVLIRSLLRCWNNILPLVLLHQSQICSISWQGSW